MSTVTENITPEKARQYLNTSTGNRPISKVYVHSYADTMKRGAWMLNGVPIVFDCDGHLQDGHHRLEAVIEAGIPVRFDVRRGVSPDCFATYDCGRRRNVGQLLAMQKVKNYNLIASIVIANDRIINSGRLYENNTTVKHGAAMTNFDNYELYRRDPKGYERVADRIVQLQGRCRILSGSWAGGLYYYLSHTGGYDEDVVDRFFDALFSLDSSGGPVELLRRVLAKEAIEGRRLKSETLWAYLVKTWNAYITGSTPRILRYQSSESMPSLILR